MPDLLFQWALSLRLRSFSEGERLHVCCQQTGGIVAPTKRPTLKTFMKFRHEIGGIKSEEMDPNSGGGLTEGEVLMGR